MHGQQFDVLTRRAAPVISRRCTVITLGGASLAALAGSPNAAARNKNRRNRNNRKCRKKARKRASATCQRQVGVCEDSFVEAGVSQGALCCDALATCDFSAFAVCLTELS